MASASPANPAASPAAINPASSISPKPISSAPRSSPACLRARSKRNTSIARAIRCVFANRATGNVPFLVTEGDSHGTQGGCGIHPAKPTQCRTFPFWPELVEDPRAWKLTARFCPGIGKGPLIQIGTAMEMAEEQRRGYPEMYKPAREGGDLVSACSVERPATDASRRLRYPSQFMPAPLEGLRVLDFSHALAGPYCTMLMAQYGADVYKIESLEGELGRTWGPPDTNGVASFFLGVNTGKRGLAIDLKKPEGIALCLDMIPKVDIMIENMRPGTLDRLGLGYEKARVRNPQLIYCSISGYGQNGPARDDPAMDLILQAASGLISVTGVEDGERVRCGHSVADITAGMFALIGILMALESRNRTGVGQFVDVSMLDSMISAMSSNFANFFGMNSQQGSKVIPGSMGTRFGTIVPYRGFPTADRDIVIAVASNKLWVDFCGAIGRTDLAEHPDYSSNALRVKNRGVLEPLITSIFRDEAERVLGCAVPRVRNSVRAGANARRGRR